MSIQSGNYSPRPSPSARPVSTLGQVVAFGFGALSIWALIVIVPLAAAWASSAVARLLGDLGIKATASDVTTFAGGTLCAIIGLFAFEFASRLPPMNPLRRSWALWDTARRTALDSIGKPFLQFFLIALISYIILALTFEFKWIARAISDRSLQPLVVAPISRTLGGAVAIAAVVIGVKSLSDYFVDGRKFLTKTLDSQTPRDPDILEKMPLEVLRFYHLVLRFAGAFAFLCECIFQIGVFGLATWGIATAFPATSLFENPLALTPTNAIAFWADRVFSLVDGPNVFGFSFSTLEANKAVWPLGVALVFFKLFVISLVVRLFNTSLNLRPEDISPAWATALARSPSSRVA